MATSIDRILDTIDGVLEGHDGQRSPESDAYRDVAPTIPDDVCWRCCARRPDGPADVCEKCRAFLLEEQAEPAPRAGMSDLLDVFVEMSTPARPATTMVMHHTIVGPTIASSVLGAARRYELQRRVRPERVVMAPSTADDLEREALFPGELHVGLAAMPRAVFGMPIIEDGLMPPGSFALISSAPLPSFEPILEAFWAAAAPVVASVANACGEILQELARTPSGRQLLDFADLDWRDFHQPLAPVPAKPAHRRRYPPRRRRRR